MNRLHDNNLDRLFAEKLDDLRVEPPERSWRKVAVGITITTTISATALSNLVRPLVWSLMAVTTVALLTVTNPTSNTQYTATPSVSENISTTTIPFEKITFLRPAEEIPVIYTQLAPQIILADMPASNIKVMSETELEVNAMLNASNNETPEWLNTIPYSVLHVPQLAWEPTLYSSANLDLTTNNILPVWFDLGFQSGVDIFDFSMQNEIRMTSLAINNGIDLSLHFSDFYIRTGVNMINLIQRNQYNYSVNEYQQVGAYAMVDSISFIQTVDSSGQPVFIPQYYTSSYPVFDSVAVEHSTKSSDQYHFLEIPLAIGFQKDIRRLSVYAQSGFSYSFLINSSELTQSKFGETQNLTPLNWRSQSLVRSENFWSFTLAAGISYNTNTHLSFGLEPSYRYCLNSLYANKERSGKAPVSYGLRFRILYKL